MKFAWKKKSFFTLFCPSLSFFKEDFNNSPEGVWERADRIIKHAQAGNNGATFRVVSAATESPACYQVTNADILEASDVMLVLWNGAFSNKSSGTSELLKQIHALGKPCALLNTLDQENPEYVKLDQLVAVDEESSGISTMSFINSQLGSKAAESFQSVWDALESAAANSSRWFRRSITISILFHGAGALIAGLAVSYAQVLDSGSLALLSGLELVLVGTALVLMLWHSHRHTQEAWLWCRFASEIMRGYYASARMLDPLFPNLRRQIPEWRRFVVSSLLKAYRENLANSENLVQLKNHYLNTRIVDQSAYFERQQKRRRLYRIYFIRLVTRLPGCLVGCDFCFSGLCLQGEDLDVR